MNFCNKIIKYSFYALFLLVPLVFTGDTAELFEFNKMWIAFILTIIISASWITKMILRKRFAIQKTPLDIPILLFLLSQIISTIISLDSHVSLWGYYTRWNGGLLSTITYIILYYAFVSNAAELGQPKEVVKKMLGVSIISGIIVALWGLPSHFGYDPTCLLFRGHLDVSCWTADFQPIVRMFSTLGQPDWLAAYLAILLPITIAMFLLGWPSSTSSTSSTSSNRKLYSISYLLLAALFYFELNFTLSRSGYLGIWAAFFVMGTVLLWKQKFRIGLKSPQTLLFGIIVLISLSVTNPFPSLQHYTLSNLFRKNSPAPSTKSAVSNIPQQPTTAAPISVGELGGSDSGRIRSYVWQGALDIAKHNPIFGTGVETFAFAYYKYKPVGHNLTSEWDFLYNKAHNEYLNMLATTGIFGLGTYLWMIGLFLWISFKLILNSKSTENLLTTALTASYVAILVTDFIGFSVVITNIYLFLIPAFVFILNDMKQKTLSIPPTSDAQKEGKFEYARLSKMGWVVTIVVWAIGLNMIYTLFNYWIADRHYYLGENYDKIAQYVTAYKELHAAVQIRNNEPVFADEMAFNDSVRAVQLAVQKQATDEAQAAQEAINTSNDLTSKYPNNLLFWKTRVRIFATLAQLKPDFLSIALEAIQKAQELAPTDAKIGYTLAVLYAQNGDIQKAIDTAKATIALKPNYKESHYALALFYRQLAVDNKGKMINPESEKLAVGELHYILEKINPKDQQTLDTLKNWDEE